MSELSHQIRIRLEGRLELLEAAVGRYKGFGSRLGGNWRRRAIEQRDGAGVCYLASGSAPALVQKLIPTRLELPISERFLPEQLSRLPPTQLEPVLGQVEDLPGGLYARAEDVSTDPGARSGQKLLLRTEGAVLEIPIGAVDFEALRTLFPWTQDASTQVP